MKNKKFGLELRAVAPAAALVLMLCATNAHALTMTFDVSAVTGNSQAPSTWYTDRFAPSGFVAQVNFAGDKRLQETISATDAQTVGNNFYNTQGRKYDLPSGTTSMSIDLYVSTAFTTSGNRDAGFWGTAFDNTNAVSAFPILEFTDGAQSGALDGTGARFRGWDNGTWINMGLPTGFTADQFYTLGIQLVGNQFVYTVGNLSLAVGAFGSTNIGNVILQGYNTPDGVNSTIYWDNLNTTAAPVPLPATLPLLLGGIAGLGAMRRRRAAAAA